MKEHIELDVETFMTINLSKLMAGDITTWGVKLKEVLLPIELNHCEGSVHRQDDYLAHFHQGNPELLIKYRKIMEGDDDEKDQTTKAEM